MSNIHCTRCETPTPAAATDYDACGELVCRDCSLEGDLQRTLEDAENSRARGGYLDRLFLSRLSGTGKRMYWVGQLIAVAILVLYLFSYLELSGPKAHMSLIFGGLGCVVAWGTMCVVIWPRKARV